MYKLSCASGAEACSRTDSLHPPFGRRLVWTFLKWDQFGSWAGIEWACELWQMAFRQRPMCNKQRSIQIGAFLLTRTMFRVHDPFMASNRCFTIKCHPVHSFHNHNFSFMGDVYELVVRGPPFGANAQALQFIVLYIDWQTLYGSRIFLSTVNYFSSLFRFKWGRSTGSSAGTLSNASGWGENQCWHKLLCFHEMWKYCLEVPQIVFHWLTAMQTQLLSHATKLSLGKVVTQGAMTAYRREQPQQKNNIWWVYQWDAANQRKVK